MEFEEEENHVSMEELESEVIANDDEDEFEYKGIEIEDDDEEEELEEEMMLPRVSCWYGADGKKYVGVIVYDPNRKCQLHDACSICFQPLSNHGKHRICSLPCGHIYGFSCINKLFLQTSSSKCPLCDNLCTHKDVILLYPGAHQKAELSTKYYTFTKQGFINFKEHDWLRRLDAKKNFTIDKQRLTDVSRLLCDVGDRQIALKRQSEDLKEKLNHKTDDALEQKVLAMEPELDALQQQYDVLQRRAAVLDQRTNVFKRRYNLYWPGLKFFKKMYKGYLAQEKKKKITTIMHQHNVSSD